MKLPRVLVIGGSDSGGGAGIEADIKTVTLLGGYALTAITALTVQDTHRVWAVDPAPPHLVRLAIEVATGDIGVDVVKIGMLGDAALIKEIAKALPAGVPVVIDPVLVSTSGTQLLPETAMEAFLEHLLPHATLITPNLPEAAALTRSAVATEADILHAAESLRRLGAQAVLIKGGHGTGSILTDRLVTSGGIQEFSHDRIDTRHTHGTGCALAAAIATGIGQGLALAEAVLRGRNYIQAALKVPPGFGTGNGPIGHLLNR